MDCPECGRQVDKLGSGRYECEVCGNVSETIKRLLLQPDQEINPKYERTFPGDDFYN